MTYCPEGGTDKQAAIQLPNFKYLCNILFSCW